MEWRKDKAYLGFFVVGVASLIGGIFMFAFIVLPQRAPDNGVPRDVQMIFTQVFSEQSTHRQSRGRHAAALVELGVDEETCRRYQCLLTLHPSGLDYEMRLRKGDQVWVINSKSPVPKEVTP